MQDAIVAQRIFTKSLPQIISALEEGFGKVTPKCVTGSDHFPHIKVPS